MTIACIAPSTVTPVANGTVSFAVEEHAREVEVSAGECPLKDLFPAVYGVVRVCMYNRQEDAEHNPQPGQLYYAVLAER